MKRRQEFLERMRKQLLVRRDELEALLEMHSHEGKPFEGQVKDSGDQAVTDSIEKVTGSLERTEIDELHQIEDALERIEKGTYGLCESCEQEISHDRLKGAPYVARCINCQELTEKQEEHDVAGE